MAVVVEELSEFLVANFPNVDQGFVSTANDYAQELIDLDEEVNEILSEIPQEGKLLVTNHAVFAYFADRYSFDRLGRNYYPKRINAIQRKCATVSFSCR